MYTKEEYGFSFSPPKMAISPISKKVPLESMHPCKNAPSRKKMFLCCVCGIRMQQGKNDVREKTCK